MTENFFAKCTKQSLSPETKWFQFLTPSPPSCLQDNSGRVVLGAGQRSAAPGPPSARSCPAVFSGQPCYGSYFCSVSPYLNVSLFYYQPQGKGLSDFIVAGHHCTSRVTRGQSLTPGQRVTGSHHASPVPGRGEVDLVQETGGLSLILSPLSFNAFQVCAATATSPFLLGIFTPVFRG